MRAGAIAFADMAPDFPGERPLVHFSVPVVDPKRPYFPEDLLHDGIPRYPGTSHDLHAAIGHAKQGIRNATLVIERSFVPADPASRTSAHQSGLSVVCIQGETFVVARGMLSVAPGVVAVFRPNRNKNLDSYECCGEIPSRKLDWRARVSEIDREFRESHEH